MTKQHAFKLCLFYFVGYLFLFPVIELFLLDTFQGEFILRFLNAFEWFFYLGFPFLMIRLVYPWLKKEVYVFLEAPLQNLWTIVKTYGLMMITSIAFNLILLMIFGLENSENQAQLMEMYSSQPFKALFASLVFAPIVEELVFRGALFAPLRKHRFLLGVLLSSFSFGFLHVYQSLFQGNFSDLMFLFSYALLGSFMCRVYDETNSFVSSMLLHFLNNFISVILTFLI